MLSPLPRLLLLGCWWVSQSHLLNDHIAGDWRLWLVIRSPRCCDCCTESHWRYSGDVELFSQKIFLHHHGATVSVTPRLRGVLDVVIVDIIRYLINRTFASHSPHPVWPVVWQPGTWHHDGWNIWHMNSSIHSVILSLYSLLCRYSVDRFVCVGRGNSLGEIMTFWTLSDVSPPISAAVGDYNYRVHWLLELSVAQCSSV